jgi:hypothetical protein
MNTMSLIEKRRPLRSRLLHSAEAGLKWTRARRKGRTFTGREMQARFQATLQCGPRGQFSWGWISANPPRERWIAFSRWGSL